MHQSALRNPQSKIEKMSSHDRQRKQIIAQLSEAIRRGDTQAEEILRKQFTMFQKQGRSATLKPVTASVAVQSPDAANIKWWNRK